MISFKEALEAFKKGYNEAKMNEQQNLEEPELETEEIVSLCVVSIEKNKDEIANLLHENSGWEFDMIEQFMTDIPAEINCCREEAVQLEQELKKLGADVYFLNDDERVYLKISSLGEKQNAVKDILIRCIHSDKATLDSLLNEMPCYLSGSIERQQRYYEMLLGEGAEVEILSAEDYEAEIYADEEQLYALQIISIGDNKVKAIKLIRDYTEMSLSEVYELVNNLPLNIGGTLAGLEAFQAELNQLGAESIIINIAGTENETET